MDSKVSHITYNFGLWGQINLDIIINFYVGLFCNIFKFRTSILGQLHTFVIFKVYIEMILNFN